MSGHSGTVEPQAYRVPAPSEEEWSLTHRIVRAVVEERILAAPDGKVLVSFVDVARVLMDLENYRDDAARLHHEKMELFNKLIAMGAMSDQDEPTETPTTA